MEKKNMKVYINICMGICISLILSLILLVGFSMILVNTNIKDNISSPVIILLTSICVLIGSMYTAKKNKKKGIIYGGIVGGTYLTFLWVISTIFIEEMKFTSQTLIMILVSILTGCLGGIVGVNFGKSK